MRSSGRPDDENDDEENPANRAATASGEIRPLLDHLDQAAPVMAPPRG